MHLVWAAGGEARLLQISADTIALESTTPSPPGSRIEGTLSVGSGRKLRVKVHGSRKEASGRFRIDGRPLDMSREAREELEALVASVAG
jgi:hypothetical protein